MKPGNDQFDPATRRAGVRRTAWIMAAVVVGLFVLTIVTTIFNI